MIVLRPATPEDVRSIKAWPLYPDEFRDLDYALRNGGWLDEYRGRSGADILVADDGGEIAGFSIIAREACGTAEFRVALRPDRLRPGIGKEIARLTLAQGFSNPAINRIRLIVRKNNPRARRLYEALQFRMTGGCIGEIQGKPLEFFAKETDKETFERCQ